MKILLQLSFVIFFCTMFTNAQANQPPSATAIFGWKAIYANDGLHLSQPDYPKTSVRIVVDRRANVKTATSFEEAKAYFSQKNGCTGLKTAQTKKDYGYAEVVASLGNKSVDKEKLPVHEYEAWDSQDNPRCVLIAQKYRGGGSQIAVIVDDGHAFKSKRIEIKEVLTEQFKKQNSDVYKAEQAQARLQHKKNTESSCKGAQSYKNWNVTWSPKDSRVYAKATSLIDKAGSGSVFVSFRIVPKEKNNKDSDKDIDKSDYFILASAQGFGKDLQMTMPFKQKLIVDGKDVYNWALGTQWSPLTKQVVAALDKGQTADLVLENIGRVRFALPNLLLMLKWGDLQYRMAQTKTKLGRCEQASAS